MLAVLRLFINGLEARGTGMVSRAPFCPAVQVEQVLGERGVWEMKLDPVGWATFAYGGKSREFRISFCLSDHNQETRRNLWRFL